MDLESTISAFIANVLSDLTERVAQAASRRWQRTLKGSEGQQALERCLSGGLGAILRHASDATTIQRDQLQAIFEEFFEQPAVSYEMAKLLRGKSLDQEELAEIFYDLGYDKTTLPGVDFAQAITSFQVGFLIAASQEPLFQPRMQTAQLIQQTGIQQELLAEIGELVTSLRQVHVQSDADAITDSPPENRLDPEHRAYLNYLFTTLRKLSLEGIDWHDANDWKAQLQLDGIYTALLTLSSKQHKPLSALAPNWMSILAWC